MFENGGRVYKALVKSADSTTGEINVSIPQVFGQGNQVSISYIGRSALYGVWKVPSPGSMIIVATDDDQFSNVFWIEQDNAKNTYEIAALSANSSELLTLASQSSDITSLLNQPELILTKLTQTINNGASANITWDTEVSDAAGFITVPSSIITIPTGNSGLYAIGYQMLPNTNGSITIKMFVDGLEMTNYTYTRISSSPYETHPLGMTMYLGAGQSIQIRVTNNNISPYVSTINRLWMKRLL